MCLNPCCSGRWSRTAKNILLLLMEFGLNPCCSGRWSRTAFAGNSLLESPKRSLNPCCSGRWSRTLLAKLVELLGPRVLILVVVDDGLVHEIDFIDASNGFSLNPCCSGRWSRTRPYKTILIINKLKNPTKQLFTFLNRKLTFP